ncbi:MAG: tetratricopeptide repeat-containing sensor histidine kinase [Bacteroidales bacterium]|nr:tetratricopeptide repeat-containing sensor histidine kinase [Bacteroidales bacterium]
MALFFWMLLFVVPGSRVACALPVDTVGNKANLLSDSARVYYLLAAADEIKFKDTRGALVLAYQGLDIADQKGYKEELAATHKCIASIYTILGHYEKALENYLAALKIFTSLNEEGQIASCNHSIGEVFMLTGDYSQASSFFSNALEINKALKNISEISMNYKGIGKAFVKQDSIDKGLSYYLVSMMIADSLKNTSEVIDLLNNIGEGYLKLKKYPVALDNFKRAAQLSLQEQHMFAHALANLNISKVYLSNNQFSTALKFALNSYRIASSEGYTQILHDTEHTLSRIYASVGNYQKAYQHYVKYKDLSDSVFNDETSKKLAIMQAKFEIENMEQENQLLRLKNEENKRTIARKNKIVTITVLLITASFFLVFLLLFINKRFKNLNRLLEEQSNELKELSLQKDKFFSFVVHNIKNPFSTIHGFSELMLKYAEQNDHEKMLRYSRYIYDSSQGIKEILANLLEWSRIQHGSYEYSPAKIHLEGLVKDILEINSKQAGKRGISLSYQELDNRYVYADRQMVYIVFQNLFSNAIKYNRDGGSVVVSAEPRGHFTAITISDTGQGISNDQLIHLFDFSYKTGLKDNSGSTGAGMGLVICKELVTKNGGEISVESSPGEGSRFTFTLPTHETESEYADNSEPSVSQQMQSLKDHLSAIENFPPELKEKINSMVLQKYQLAGKGLSSEGLKEFSESLVSVADEYQIDPLKEYGQKVLKYSGSLQFDKILKIMPEFQEIVKIINRS